MKLGDPSSNSFQSYCDSGSGDIGSGNIKHTGSSNQLVKNTNNSTSSLVNKSNSISKDKM